MLSSVQYAVSVFFVETEKLKNDISLFCGNGKMTSTQNIGAKFIDILKII